MNYIFILAILVTGLSGIVAQVLLLRELLVSFYGSELTLGIILANWLILEALGVFITGRFIERIKNKISAFIILQMIFALAFPLAIYLSRAFKVILGVPFGEALGLPAIFYSSFFIILPVSFCHGALFSCGCRIYSSYAKEPASSIGKIYTRETLGTIIGGIALTCLFIPYLNSFQTAFIVSMSCLVLGLFFFKEAPKILKYITLFLIFVMTYLALGGGINNIHRSSISRQWKGQEVLDYRNSIYANIVVTQRENQRTFFYNGLPVVTTPYPDITFVDEFGHLPLLFHPQAEDVLILSSGAGGLINEILKHPVKSIDYAELDPLVIKMLKKYPSVLTQREFSDKRVNIINLDGRFFLRAAVNRYDVVLLGLSRPADLSTNRLFTEEFFSLVKNRLKPEGILALWLPGSLTYLSKEVRDLNFCIINGLKNTYKYVRIIPGDYNIILASAYNITAIGPGLITRRLEQQGIKTNVLLPAYLDYRLDKKWLDWFVHSSEGATKKVNQDFRPYAVFKMLVFWNKQFSPRFAHILNVLGNLDLKTVSVLILAITFVLFLIFYYRDNPVKLSIAYSIATTGFFGMLINLVLIFGFQVIYGYLYQRIGVLISIFMAGIACGSILMTGNIKKIKNSLNLFVRLEVTVALLSFLAVPIITALPRHMNFSQPAFIIFFFISGLLMGCEFPLASKMYLGEKSEIGLTVGTLYFADLLGGWLAGILGGVIFLPVLGLRDTCMIIMFFKLSSLLLLLIFAKRLTKARI